MTFKMMHHTTLFIKCVPQKNINASQRFFDFFLMYIIINLLGRIKMDNDFMITGWFSCFSKSFTWAIVKALVLSYFNEHKYFYFWTCCSCFKNNPFPRKLSAILINWLILLRDVAWIFCSEKLTINHISCSYREACAFICYFNTLHWFWCVRNPLVSFLTYNGRNQSVLRTNDR